LGLFLRVLLLFPFSTIVQSGVPEPAAVTICQCGGGYTHSFDILAHLPSSPPLNFNNHSVKKKNEEDEKDDDDIDDDNINKCEPTMTTSTNVNQWSPVCHIKSATGKVFANSAFGILTPDRGT
jgi:hypothetical protein